MSYPGGKNGAGVYQTLINLMPPHDQYIEPFLGMGGVMRHKKPACWSIGIDQDIFVIGEWAQHAIPGLIVECDDGIRFLKKYPRIHSRTLVYCDPPYLMSSRLQQRQIYRCELKEKDHSLLLRILKNLKCMVMISGYRTAMYEDELRGWRQHSFQSMTRGGKPATEVVWMNFPQPQELHDYRFLGSSFRKREVIHRRIQRWVRRLSKMPELERLAIIDALSDVRSPEALTNKNSDGGRRNFLPATIDEFSEDRENDFTIASIAAVADGGSRL